MRKEGNETVTNCNALKMRASDGKMRLVIVSLTFGIRYSRLGIATDLSVTICRMLAKLRTSSYLSFIRQKSLIF